MNLSTLLMFIFLLLSFSFAMQAQNVDSLVQVINHSKSVQDINNAKKKVPVYLQKVDMNMLDVIRLMRVQGINRANTASQQVRNRFSTPLVLLDNQGNFSAEIYLKQFNDVSIAKLKALGIIVEYTDQNFKRVTCKIPFYMVENLAQDTNVTGIYNFGIPHVNVGTYTTAGDHILSADLTRSTYGINGASIKVGIISDGVDHWTSSRDHGDLPSSFQVINNRIGGDEGTAMSEIIYDIAPGASLAFADESYSDADFANNITLLKNAGCNVIVDDISWSDEPMFEDGTIAQAVDAATAAGIKYISAAGNDATETWDGQSIDANSNSWMEFSSSDETNSVTVEHVEKINVILQWANKWGSSHDDFDLYVMDGSSPTSNVLAKSIRRQNGSGTPYELAQWTNPSHTTSQTVYIRVKYYSVQVNREAKLVVWKDAWWDQLHYTKEHAIWGHAAASSCISVGAIDASDGQTLEQYSSHGPSRIYSYNANGNPVSYIDRATPTICGIDGVETYVGMSGLWYPYPSGHIFYGTSAAAPHIAGVTALVLSLTPFTNLTWQQIEQKITLTATKVSGMAGQNFTNAYGYGRADNYQTERNVYVNATIPAGKTLQLTSGASLVFANSTSLTVNSTINATNATFDRSGSTSWGGIVFNSGSSGSLSGCTIEHAGWGITCNGVLPTISNCNISGNSIELYLNNIGTTSTTISNNYFYQNTGQAISCYYSSPHFVGNHIINNQFAGMFCLGSSPQISNTEFNSNNYGLYLLSNSQANIGAYNGMIANVTAIYAESPCNVYSGSSDVYTMEPGYYAVQATNSARVFASTNYWGQYPPDPTIFSAANGASIFYLPGATSPWTNLLKISASENSVSSGTIVPANDPPDFSLDDSLIEAASLMMNKNYDKAGEIYNREFNSSNSAAVSSSNTAKKKYLLSQLAECYRASGKDGFIAFLNNSVRPSLSKNNELYATTLELENMFLIDNKNYQKTIDNLNTLQTNFTNDKLIDKYSLFNLGYVYGELVGDVSKGKEYFDELAKKYPGDILSLESRILLGEADSAEVANHFAMSKKGGNNSVEITLPDKYDLLQNYPNPFNPSTVINYQVPKRSLVVIKIYDILGKELKTLVNEYKDQGRYTVTFDGSGLASGVYFYRLQATDQSVQSGDYISIKKMLLLK